MLKISFFQIGAKIVTLPKFEPEEYIQALVTYKVITLAALLFLLNIDIELLLRKFGVSLNLDIDP